MRAKYRPRSGFSDRDIEPRDVSILGFVEATIDPKYHSSGSKRCIVAVIADADGGRLSTAELSELTIA